MQFHILGLFPDSLDQYLQTSLLGKAREAGLLQFSYHQLRDWGVGNYKQVDDKPYGGGAGMVFLPEVVVPAVSEIKAMHAIDHVVLTSPSGKLFNSKKAETLSQKKSILFLCGRFEGVDQRAIDLVVDEELSLGDYVLNGGEIAAAVMIEAISRFVPGVVGREESVQNDSFAHGLLEHPLYTRPEKFNDLPVPEALLSGHHKNIEAWKREQSLYKTWQRRPDLLKQAGLTDDELQKIKNWIHKKNV